MNPNKPQSKPQQDEEPTFSLSEREKVRPSVAQVDPQSRVAGNSALEKRIADVFESEILPTIQPPLLPEQTSSNKDFEQDISNAKAELQAILTEVKRIAAQAAESAALKQPEEVKPDNTNEATQRDTDRADATTKEDTARADERSVPTNEATQRDTDRADAITKEDTDRADERTKGSKDEKKGDEGTERQINEGKPVANSLIGKIYIPGVTPFVVWDKIKREATGRNLSLKCVVSNLTVTDHSFVDEFSPGTIEQMVEFDADGKQTSFTMPLAEQIDAQGNSWLPCTQGGVYSLPVYCVSGKPAIFPTKHT